MAENLYCLDFDSISNFEQVVSDISMCCCVLNVLWLEKKEPRFSGCGSEQLDELIYLHLSLFEQYVSDLNVFLGSLSNNRPFNREVVSNAE